ncbi:MAG: SpoIID/LytB domain-containing protein [Candidatus Zixiibacteriota bacterium]|nr:MAG: SpoIID/LytB domain-containing protein [candidate division Zixibacteria bacterium]
MKRLLIAVFLSTLLLSLSCSYMGYALRQQGYDGLKRPWIRVRVLQGNADVTISAKGSFVVRTWDANNEKSAYYSATPVLVQAVGGVLNLLDQKGNLLEQRLRKVTITPGPKKTPYLNNRTFHGIFEFHPLKSDSFYTVNVLNIEDYLRGVLQPEIGNRTEDEFEAVKAQAVAARTYAFITKDKYPDREYDLINDIGDQVYTGIAGEQDITNRAAEATRGEVLMYGDDLIDAYYHSTCGGRTDNIEEIWDKGMRPYLVGVADSGYCRWSKFFDWNELYPTAEFLDHVRDYFKTVNGDAGKIGKRLIEATISDRTTGGRVKAIQLTTDRGSVVLRKDQIRWAFGRHDKSGILPSTNFAISLGRDEDGVVQQVHIIGCGYGHGIGMCQCGAIGMARVGYTYQQILTHFYTGVRIRKLY